MRVPRFPLSIVTYDFPIRWMGKRRTNWPLNEQWGRFIGRNRKEIQLTSDPKPYTIERTLNWLGRQVAPTWKMAKELDRLNQTTYIQDMVQKGPIVGPA